jgi:hypothetical protein
MFNGVVGGGWEKELRRRTGSRVDTVFVCVCVCRQEADGVRE